MAEHEAASPGPGRCWGTRPLPLPLLPSGGHLETYSVIQMPSLPPLPEVPNPGKEIGNYKASVIRKREGRLSVTGKMCPGSPDFSSDLCPSQGEASQSDGLT